MKMADTVNSFKIKIVFLISLVLLLIPLDITISPLNISYTNEVYAIWCDGGCNPDYATCQDCPTGQTCQFNVCVDTTCTSNAQCGGTNVCCQGQCVGAGQCGGGGGGQCANPNAFGINCPAGTVRGPSLVNRQCIRPSYCVGPGTAQLSNVCCQWTGGDRTCGDFYCCRWNQYNQCTRTCRDCYETPVECAWNYIDTYECLSTCNTTAPSAVSFSDDLLTWTTGTNGASQNLYVSTTQSDVTNNCGTGTSCTVNANLASSTDFYPFVSPLLPDTIYFVKIVNYQSATCSAFTNYSFLTPVANEPWWQVRDGDVTTNGVLSSLVPAGNYFLSDGLGGFSGVAVYGTSLNLYLDTPERISVNIWNANTTSTLSRIFNYSYFENLIPNDIVFNDINDLPSGGAVVDSNGYEWYKVVGNLDTVGDIDITTRRVILFVEEGNFNINGNINLTDGVGFFVSFVNGSITIDSAVTGSPAIEGIYMADNNISTGAGDTQLHLRGSLASYGSVLLERELLDNSTPAELVEFAPDQMMLFPNQLQFKRAKWAEVAP